MTLVGNNDLIVNFANIVDILGEQIIAADDDLGRRVDHLSTVLDYLNVVVNKLGHTNAAHLHERVGEPFFAALFPHELNTRRNDDEERPFGLVVASDRQALNRLAETHVVGEQETTVLLHGKADSFDLKGKQTLVNDWIDASLEVLEIVGRVESRRIFSRKLLFEYFTYRLK